MGERARIATAATGEPAWFEPIALNRRAAAAQFPLKIAALNLQGSGNVEAIVRRLERPPLHGVGVLLLSEVGWRTRPAGRREVAAELAAALGMSFVFAPSWGYAASRGGPIVSLKGCAILSAQPLGGVTTAPIALIPRKYTPHRRVDRTVGIIASIMIGGRELKLGVVHLNRRGSPQFRDRQMAEFLAPFPPDGPAVIGGDFNTTTLAWTPLMPAKIPALMMLQPRRFHDPARYELLLGRLLEAGFAFEGANCPLKPTFTFTRFIPPAFRPKLDWIAVRGLRAVPGSAAVVPPRVSFLSPRFSDHDLVLCEVAS